MIWGAVTRSLGDLLPPQDVPGPEGFLFSDSDQQIRLQKVVGPDDLIVGSLLMCFLDSILL